MSDKKERSIKIDYLLTLLNMFDDYKSFSNDLLVLLKSQSGNVNYESFGALFKNVDSIDNDSIKTLIDNHKKSIEVVKKYISMTGFMYDVYEYKKPEKNKYSTLEYCYNLVKIENLDIDKTIKLAEHIEKLGFSIINYCDKKFTDTVYTLKSEKLDENYSVYYVDNMRMLPRYLERSIEYVTDDSSYLIELRPKSYKYYNNRIDKEIYLNSLSFDIDSLPQSITKEDIFDVIVSLAHKNKESIAITDSINMNKGINNINKAINGAYGLFDKIDSVSEKEELIKSLKELETVLDKMKSVSSNYERNIYEKFGLITIGLLNREMHKQKIKKKI